MSSLVAWVDQIEVGTLDVDRGTWSFEYDRRYASSLPTAFPLSTHFPLDGPPKTFDTPDDRRVEWYFANLLPEGGVRRAIASYARLDPDDTLGLLRAFGEESAGALSLLVPGVEPVFAPEPAERYIALTDEDLRAAIHDLPRVPLLAAGGRAKMSLAGARHKLGVRWCDGRFLLPKGGGGGASSHILKPDNARPEAYPFCPANEHFIMSLARAVHLPVPATALVHLPEPIYVVERYDRTVDQVGIVRRLHQIDLCQLLNRWPAFKYEADGGATFADVFEAANLTRQPAAAKNQLIRWLVFDYLVGNSDAHAKNVSFLVSRDGFTLAPFYDLLCVRAYGDDTLAMTVGGEDKYGIVTGASWDALATALGLRPAFLRRVRRELARDVVRAAEALILSRDFTKDERDFLGAVLDVVRDHAGFATDGLR
jgi:serine/threonine-protein kinase HipA